MKIEKNKNLENFIWKNKTSPLLKTPEKDFHLWRGKYCLFCNISFADKYLKGRIFKNFFLTSCTYFQNIEKRKGCFEVCCRKLNIKTKFGEYIYSDKLGKIYRYLKSKLVRYSNGPKQLVP